MDNCFVFCGQALDGVPGGLAHGLDDAFIVAVDSGIKHFAKIKVKPNLWVGDGDSSLGQKKLLQSSKFKKVKLKPNKDYSDFEYALHLIGDSLIDGGWQGDLYLLGAQGGRFDHDLINLLVIQRWLQDLASAVGAENCPSVFSYGVNGVCMITVNEVEFHQPKKAVFSVCTLGGKTRISVSGAKFKLRSKVLEHASHGLSNFGLGKAVSVAVEQVAVKGQETIVVPAVIIIPAKK